MADFPEDLLKDPRILKALSDIGVYMSDYVSGESLSSKTWRDVIDKFEVDSDHEAFLDNIHPEDREMVMTGLNNVAEGKTDSFNVIYRQKKKDGHYKWIKSNGKAVSYQKSGKTHLFLGSDLDITELKETEKKLKASIDLETERSRELHILREIATSISRSLDLDETMTTILEELKRLIPYKVGSIQFLRKSFLEVVGVVGFENNASKIGLQFPYPKEGSLSTKAIQSRKQVMTNDIKKDFPAFVQPEEENEVHSWIGIPLISQGEPLGLMALDGFEKNCFNGHHLEIAELIGDQVAIAIQNAMLHEKAYNMAMIDALTGLGSRHRFQLEGRLLLEGAIRTETPLSLAILDIDRFKLVNDTYGHDTGDIILKRIAETCTRALRDMDIICRYGGEEFVMILPSTHKDAAFVAVDRIRSHIEVLQHPEIGRPVTISGGVYTAIPGRKDKLNGFLAKADEALYEAKSSGRNMVCSYEEE